MTLQLGTFGAWFNPAYDDSTRVKFVVESEALGYATAWLGLGRRSAARAQGCCAGWAERSRLRGGTPFPCVACLPKEAARPIEPPNKALAMV